MKRTTAPGSTGGLYTDGNPGLGIPATTLVAEDRNMEQEELVNAILCAGLSLDGTGTDTAQLSEAIRLEVSKGAGRLRLPAAAAVTHPALLGTEYPTAQYGAVLKPTQVAASNVAYIPVVLPHGRTVTEFEVTGYCVSAGYQITAELVQVRTDNLTTVMASISKTAGGWSSVSDTSIVAALVDTTQYAYYVRLVLFVPPAGSLDGTQFTTAAVTWE